MISKHILDTHLDDQKILFQYSISQPNKIVPINSYV